MWVPHSPLTLFSKFFLISGIKMHKGTITTRIHIITLLRIQLICNCTQVGRSHHHLAASRGLQSAAMLHLDCRRRSWAAYTKLSISMLSDPLGPLRTITTPKLALTASQETTTVRSRLCQEPHCTEGANFTRHLIPTTMRLTTPKKTPKTPTAPQSPEASILTPSWNRE